MEKMDLFHNALTHEVRLDAGTIRYRELGSGEPIVFVHGLLVNGFLWRKVVPVLADEFRCIVPDWPLGSHSVALDASADLTPPGIATLIADFLTALDLKNVTLVANDTGGAFSQVLVTRHPERIRRLVLTPSDAFDNFLPPLFRPLQWFAHVPGAIFLIAQTLRASFLHSTPLVFGGLAKHGIERSISETYVRPAISDQAVRRDLIKVLKGISTKYTLEAAERLNRFEGPVLLAWAREDRLFPFAHAVRLSKIFPNACAEAIDDSYTFVSEDQPEQLAVAIARFMRATGSAS